jgi:hypothetical protein
MPYLTDHCFYRQPDDWPEPADRYPVVPLTTVLELMADAARALVPGRTVVGVREVRALRWLAVAPPVTVATNASLNPDGNVTVVLDGYARGTVLLADDYPAPPRLPERPLTGQRPCEVSAQHLYSGRHRSGVLLRLPPQPRRAGAVRGPGRLCVRDRRRR